MKLSISTGLKLLLLHSIVLTGAEWKHEQLDDEGNVVLDWEFDPESDTIHFKLEAASTGYIGFGISPQGGMIGADIFIAGVYANGTTYHGDYFASGFVPPKFDDEQNWDLINATEEGGKTILEFKRKRYTCDDAEDYPIGVDTTRVIWSLGETDDLSYHGADPSNRGTRSMNLIGESMPELNRTGLKVHQMSLEIEMPEADTTYWCSYHKGPLLTKKHHIVALDALLPDFDSSRHTHHFILSQCTLPPGSNQTLEEVYGNYTVESGFMGGDCMDRSEGLPELPLDNCIIHLFAWGKGGKMTVFPEDVGYPIGEDTESQAYYKLETHYDNPDKLSGLTFPTGVAMYYTDELRKHDAGTLVLGQVANLILTVPPNQTNFTLTAYCTSNCTNWGIGNGDGLTVINVGLHSHLSGRKMKVRHFRGQVELPWLAFDNNYDFDYQQNRPIKPLQVMPGDDLVVECTYDSTWYDGKTVVGGFTTRNEMCMAYLFYYPRDEMVQCMSQVDFGEHLETFGITRWHEEEGVLGPTMYIDEPAHMRGPYEEGINNFTWSPGFIQALELSRRYGEQELICVKHSGDYKEAFGSFPSRAAEYIPEQEECTPSDEDGTTTSEGEGTTQKSGATTLSQMFVFFLVPFIFYL